jgi:hypothetical protein
MSVKFSAQTKVYKYKREQKKITLIPPRTEKQQQDILSSLTRFDADDLNYKLSLARGKISHPIFIIYTDKQNSSRTSRFYIEKYLMRIFPELASMTNWKSQFFTVYSHINIGSPIYILREEMEDIAIPYIKKIRKTQT